MEDVEGIWIRQTGIINPTKLTHKIAIIGAGSIGGWTAMCLGKLGCQDITVMDFDNVEIHNAGSQVYKVGDEGQPKVDALKFRLDMVLENSIKTEQIRWSPTKDLREFDIVIAAVDNITNRGELFKHLEGTNILYIDARMASNAIEIYPVRCSVEEDCRRYEQTLFAENEAREIPCSERSVVYNVMNVASWIARLVSAWANLEELPKAIEIDMFNYNLYNEGFTHDVA